MEAKMADALDAKMKVDSQLSELLRKSGNADQHEKQMAMLEADRDARAAEAKAATEPLASAEAQLARIRGTYQDIIHERDELQATEESLSSDARVAAQGAQLTGDWQPRYKNAADQ